MMWYKNKANRLRFSQSLPEPKISENFIRKTFDYYVAIKESHTRSTNLITCSQCGTKKEIFKKDKSHRCKCGVIYNEFKNKRFKNFSGRYVIQDNLQDEYKTKNYWLIYYRFNYITKLIEFTQYLVAKEMYSEEKNNCYHHNYGYTKPCGWQEITYSYRENPSERYLTSHIQPSLYHYRNMRKFKYIDLNDRHIMGYEIGLIKNNEYLIEILQKYKSTYLFSQLRNRTKSNKILDLLNMRDSGLSNKDVIRVIKYYAKTESLDITLYKDYLHDFKVLDLTPKLINKDYKNYHLEMQKLIEIKSSNEKDQLLKKINEKRLIYEDKKIKILAPQSVNDLKEEGNQLNHCVGNYANKIIKGESQVYFVRKDINEPMLTVEIREGKLTQLRGKNNLTTNIPIELLNYVKQVFSNKMGVNYV